MPLPSENRFRGDVLWNLAATGLLGACGLALNVLVGRFHGPEVFGIFSQVLAVYYVLSQLAVGGFGFSALRSTAEEAGHRERAGQALLSAAVLAALLAALVCVAAWLARHAVGRFFGSPGVAVGILWVLPGLWFFAINKVLLFGINGLGQMRFYAAANALRYVLILAAAAALTAAGADGLVLPAALSLGEVVLFVVLAIPLARSGHLPLGLPRREWLAVHLGFGGRTFFSGLLLDVNPRIDVIMLGYFVSDRVVGVYGFASMLAEGLYQIVWVVQTNVTPILSRLRAERRMDEVRELVRRNARLLPPALAALALPIAWLYPQGAELLTGDPAFAEGQPWFAVLAAGLVVGSSYLPFGFLLNQWNHPGAFMAYLVLLVAVNVVANALLIPVLGALGAALGTAIALALAIVHLKVLTRLVTGQRI